MGGARAGPSGHRGQAGEWHRTGVARLPTLPWHTWRAPLPPPQPPLHPTAPKGGERHQLLPRCWVQRPGVQDVNSLAGRQGNRERACVRHNRFPSRDSAARRGGQRRRAGLSHGTAAATLPQTSRRPQVKPGRGRPTCESVTISLGPGCASTGCSARRKRARSASTSAGSELRGARVVGKGGGWCGVLLGEGEWCAPQRPQN